MNRPTPPTPVPGHHSPGVGFEQPFDMLLACHERVERTLTLLERLTLHVDQHGVDAAARSAAADVLRYFDVAAPQHHQDEERHVFPRLGADLAQTLQQEHLQLNRLWCGLRDTLTAWIGSVGQPMSPSVRTDSVRFIALYRQHAATEEAHAFPDARGQMSAPEQAAMGNEMRKRRQMPPSPPSC